MTSSGQAAVLAALSIYGAKAGKGSPWMPAADLASFVGAPGADDPQFEAVVRSLYAAGAIRLIAAETEDGETGFKAMLVRPT